MGVWRRVEPSDVSVAAVCLNQRETEECREEAGRTAVYVFSRRVRH